MNEDFESLISLSDVAIDRAIAKQSLHEFIKMAWHCVVPAEPFIDNWHIELLCKHLEAAAYGDPRARRMVVNVPPGTMKSLTFGVFFPAWCWGPARMPGKKFIFGSYSDRVSFRDSNRTRRLIDCRWYQERWPVKLLSKAVGKFDTAEGGFRMATTVRGGVTGEHADIQIVDDPLKPLEVTKSLKVEGGTLKDCLEWWNETMSTRVVSITKSVRIIIMQRLHADDLAGEMLKRPEYLKLVLPMHYDKDRHCVTPFGEDQRTEDRELLFPARFPESAVQELMVELGSRGTDAQLQQNPVPDEGNIILKEWFRFWKQGELPHRWVEMIQSWDCTFKDSDNTDFVVGQVWGLDYDGNYWLLDQIRGRMGLIATCRAIKRMTLRWPKSRRKLVENKANGPAVVEALANEVAGLVEVNPEGGKVARVHGVEPIWESGKVIVPSPEVYDWVDHPEEGFISEITGFPSRKHDDQVDCMSQALTHLEKSSLKRLKKAMNNVRLVG